jgi:hypothetical protein
VVSACKPQTSQSQYHAARPETTRSWMESLRLPGLDRLPECGEHHSRPTRRPLGHPLARSARWDALRQGQSRGPVDRTFAIVARAAEDPESYKASLTSPDGWDALRTSAKCELETSQHDVRVRETGGLTFPNSSWTGGKGPGHRPGDCEATPGLARTTSSTGSEVVI